MSYAVSDGAGRAGRWTDMSPHDACHRRPRRPGGRVRRVLAGPRRTARPRRPAGRGARGARCASARGRSRACRRATSSGTSPRRSSSDDAVVGIVTVLLWVAWAAVRRERGRRGRRAGARPARGEDRAGAVDRRPDPGGCPLPGRIPPRERRSPGRGRDRHCPRGRLSPARRRSSTPARGRRTRRGPGWGHVLDLEEARRGRRRPHGDADGERHHGDRRAGRHGVVACDRAPGRRRPLARDLGGEPRATPARRQPVGRRRPAGAGGLGADDRRWLAR